MPFKKGQSGNPKGRTPGFTSVAERIRATAGEDGARYVCQLDELATAHEDARIRLGAISLLLDRGYGKPPTDVNLSGTMTARTVVQHEYLPAPPKQIDAKKVE